ncbi:hypothetical protein SMITH_476 [Smithella sp. ME-1]|uniref:DUF3783 domain-containing protein n=1 Tax=hydrocarbon metagenome TaxID=938273 RepID=A0A0W8FM94_9ZZZZ|nr:hypothetical protein SMITH_476 [Smithella sp. ME-1]
MKEKIICFSLGLSEEDIEKGRASFCGKNKEAPPLEVIALNKSMLSSKVGDVLDCMTEDSWPTSAGKQQGSALSPGIYKYRVVIVLTSERERVLQIMRNFKAVLSEPQNIIFAVITQTALTWTFEEYIEHLGNEHEYMKTRK